MNVILERIDLNEEGLGLNYKELELGHFREDILFLISDANKISYVEHGAELRVFKNKNGDLK